MATVESPRPVWHRVIFMSFGEWYTRTYPELTGHGRWLRGGELNTLAPAEWQNRRYRVLFTRLSTWSDTLDSFTHGALYQLAAGLEGVFPDLAYLPPRDDLKIFERDRIPWLIGSGSKRGARDFDLVGFSNSNVQELLNLPHFLRRSGIPLSRKERLARPDLPVLLLGGANALYSTALWNEDSWVDAVFVGECDEAIRKILNLGRDLKAAGASKAEFLEQLGKVDGVILPERPRPTRKARASDLNQSAAYTHGPVPLAEEQLGSGQLQISEGCPCFCTFCAESWERKPYRERSANRVLESALEAKIHRGLDSVDLYSFNFNLHSGFYPLLWELVPLFRSIGLKSQRFDLLGRDPVMADVQHAVEKASFTCGLEGISPRLRRYLRKNLADEDLRRALGSIFKSRCREIKIFCIATGIEENEDFEAFGELLESLKKMRHAAHSSARLIFSMTPLVRFPWTPMEYEDGIDPSRVQGLIAKAAGRVRQAGFEFREAAEVPEYWVSQILARATDPKIAEALAEASEIEGATPYLYYRFISEKFRSSFEAALRKRGLEPAVLLKAASPATRGPWAWVDTGIKPEFLVESWEKSRRFQEDDYCLGRAGKQARCLHCGGCPTRFHVRDIVLARQERRYSLEQFQRRVKHARDSEISLSFDVEVGPASRGLPRRALAVALARALMRTDPELARSYRGFRSSDWGEGVPESWTEGAERLTLAWDRAGLKRVEAICAPGQALARVNSELGDWGRLNGITDSRNAGFTVRIRLTSPLALRLDEYLRSRELKHTLRSRGDGSYDYEWTPAALKKGLFRSLQVLSRNPGELVLTPGPKFTPQELERLCREAFVLQHPEEWVRVRCHVETDASRNSRGARADELGAEQ